MKTSTLLIAGCVALGLGLSSFASESKRTEMHTLEGAGITSLKVDTGAGDVVLEGANVEDMSVEVSIWGNRIDEDDYELIIEKRGDTARLYMHMEKGRNLRGSVDLHITAPQNWALDMQDTSGELSIRNMQNGLIVEDSSGDINIRDVSGGVSVRDSSGDVSLVTITGDINIDDRSGDIEVITATGNVELEDRSGDILIRTVSGNVDIDDGSGDIDVVGIGGAVTASDGSGDIYVKRAAKFSLHRDGSGDVHLEDVESRQR